MIPSSDLSAFGRLITALEPWLRHIVIIGGWAHRLYRLHPKAQSLDYMPLTTQDADIAVPSALPVHQDDIRERLHQAGFDEDFVGTDHPPATHYRLSAEQGAFYAEFLAPLVGGEYDRRGKRVVTGRVGGITVQRLRHVGLLLDDPWEINLDLSSASYWSGVVRIAHPVRFLAQKLLIYPHRSRNDRAKDILDIHDTLEVFGARLAELRNDWETSVMPRLHRRHVAELRKSPDILFGNVHDEIRAAATIAAGRILTPEAVRETCQYGLHRLFT